MYSPVPNWCLNKVHRRKYFAIGSWKWVRNRIVGITTPNECALTWLLHVYLVKKSDQTDLFQNMRCGHWFPAPVLVNNDLYSARRCADGRDRWLSQLSWNWMDLSATLTHIIPGMCVHCVKIASKVVKNEWSYLGFKSGILRASTCTCTYIPCYLSTKECCCLTLTEGRYSTGQGCWR